MSFLSKLFGRQSPRLPSIEHLVFGRMDATLEPAPGLYFWETPGSVVTEFGEVSVFCDAPMSGPTERQVAQFRQVCVDFPDLWKAARPILLDRLSDFRAEGQIDKIRWASILLATDGAKTSHWELTFEETERPLLLNVNFQDGVPAFVTVDA